MSDAKVSPIRSIRGGIVVSEMMFTGGPLEKEILTSRVMPCLRLLVDVSYRLTDQEHSAKFCGALQDITKFNLASFWRILLNLASFWRKSDA